MATHFPVLLPGKSPGWTSLVGYNPWGLKQSDTTERLHFHFSLSCIEEGNGNPLQCSCLENPRNGGAWWAAIYGVAQSRTRLKRLSSSRTTFNYFQTDFSFLCFLSSHSFPTEKFTNMKLEYSLTWKSDHVISMNFLCKLWALVGNNASV